MRINKVVTKIGDGGTTRLVGNVEVSKDDTRIHSYGTVDELNSVLGVASAELQAALVGQEQSAWRRIGLNSADATRLFEELSYLQNKLFDLGADLATPVSKRWEGFVATTAEDTDKLEEHVDSWNAELEPLREFVLPGGGPVAAQLHVARTVCRRAERITVALINSAGDQSNVECRRYLNRLSDLLFVLARWAAVKSGYGEVLWKRI